MSGGALLCGLQNCFTRVRKETIIPSCPHCQKKEEVPYKDVPAARKRFWVWHDDKELFMCTVCTASCKIEERQKEQVRIYIKGIECSRFILWGRGEGASYEAAPHN